jgi:hypothetical protein
VEELRRKRSVTDHLTLESNTQTLQLVFCSLTLHPLPGEYAQAFSPENALLWKIANRNK